jgi:hypothetical protein
MSKHTRMRGARTSHVRSFKQTPLHAASGNGHEAVVRVLLDAGADFKARDK